MQGGLRAFVIPPQGAPEPAWRLLHFQEHGAGPNLSLRPTQVSHQAKARMAPVTSPIAKFRKGSVVSRVMNKGRGED